MKVCIKTAGRTGKRLFDQIKQIKEITVVSFMDNDVRKWTNAIEGIPIESSFGAYKRYLKGNIDKILIGTEMSVKECRAIYKELVEIGFTQDNIYFVPIDFLKNNSKKLEFMTYNEFNYLQYVEFHLTNRCNLNCSGCSHFIPLIPKEEEVDFGELKADLRQLKNKVSHISEIRIMGGEPLVSLHLQECCVFVRGLWPYANIRIVTNGILVKKMNEELLQTLKAEKIKLDITCYPPMYDKYEDIAKFLKLNNIEFAMDIRWGMCPVLHKDGNHRFKHDCTALSCECYNLYKGYLYPCPLAAYISYFNNYYHQDFPENEGISIYSEDSFEIMYNDLIRNKKICDYCDHYGMTRNYNRNKYRLCSERPKIEDWVRKYENRI